MMVKFQEVRWISSVWWMSRKTRTIFAVGSTKIQAGCPVEAAKSKFLSVIVQTHYCWYYWTLELMSYDWNGSVWWQEKTAFIYYFLILLLPLFCVSIMYTQLFNLLCWPELMMMYVEAELPIHAECLLDELRCIGQIRWKLIATIEAKSQLQPFCSQVST